MPTQKRSIVAYDHAVENTDFAPCSVCGTFIDVEEGYLIDGLFYCEDCDDLRQQEE